VLARAKTKRPFGCPLNIVLNFYYDLNYCFQYATDKDSKINLQAKYLKSIGKLVSLLDLMPSI
jgi:hypothetical protein